MFYMYFIKSKSYQSRPGRHKAMNNFSRSFIFKTFTHVTILQSNLFYNSFLVRITIFCFKYFDCSKFKSINIIVIVVTNITLALTKVHHFAPLSYPKTLLQPLHTQCMNPYAYTLYVQLYKVAMHNHIHGLY